MVTDVSVIGGGPAGLAAAIAARNRGLSVTVLDARRPPIDKPCGEGLLPGAFPVLRELGIEPTSLPGAPLRGIRFSGDNLSVFSRFPNGEGRGVRRAELHAALVERAENCGVQLQWNTPVSDFSALKSRWIIGADGIQSRVRTWSRLDATSRDSRRFGFQRHYELPPWSDEVEVYWGDTGQAYVTPVSPNEIGIAVLTRHRSKRIDDILSEFPDLQRRLSGTTASERGALIASRKLRRVTQGNVALIGDASGSVDAITGEGLALSFRQALLLAQALETDNLKLYEQGHSGLSTRPRFMGDLMLLLDRSRFLRRRTLSVMAARPGLFSALVALHTGESTVSELLTGCVKLGWWLAVTPVRNPTR